MEWRNNSKVKVKKLLAKLRKQNVSSFKKSNRLGYFALKIINESSKEVFFTRKKNLDGIKLKKQYKNHCYSRSVIDSSVSGRFNTSGHDCC
jgi:hypothetical protein